ncbi:hypothetical protein JL721_8617 [Aureococcus anophagefferens]|nr:hypothetical protein JL721_8617 [Aureococcus anophagefferens]
MRAAWGCLALVAAAPRHEQQDALQSHQLKRWYDCVDPSGEAYGAAWLAHRDTVLAHRIDKKIAENTNMETGGWIPRELATPRQSVDLYDCGVEHLSWLERRIGLRDARGEAKETLDAELLDHLGARGALRRRSARARTASPHRLDRRRLPLLRDVAGLRRPGQEKSDSSLLQLLNATFWSVHAALTRTRARRTRWTNRVERVRAVVLSTCSAADAAFARTSSGLPFFDVLLSDCHLDSQKRRFFAARRAKSLLGALTVARVREKLKSAKAWAPFHYVYYSEADQVLYVRDAWRVIAVVDEGHYVSPHRMQPLAHPVDLPALAVKANQLWLPRWSRDDLRRIRNVGDYDNVTEGNYGQLLFRGCTPVHEHNAALHGCPA